MTDEKISISDIRKAISKQMSLPEETASRFLAALFPTIIDGLKADKVVRISGLGSFKLVWIEPRKSVNIQTGESILLDGYNKLTFIPESYIREQINEPFAGMEAVRVNENGQPLDPKSTLPGIDPLIRFGEQANEIKGILADLGQDIAEHPEPAKQPQPTIPEPPQTKQDKPTQQSELPKQPEQPSRFRPWLIALITVLILLAMLVAGYFILVDKLEDWANSLNKPTEEQISIQPEEEVEILDIELLQPIDSLQTDSASSDSLVMVEALEPIPVSVNGERVYDSFFAIETVRPGSRLVQIARRYFGNKDMWVFIYEANKDVIKDPANLKAGIRLKIPKLPDQLKDTTNPQTAALIERLQKEYSK